MAEDDIVVDASFMAGNKGRQKLTRREYMALLDEFEERQIFRDDWNKDHVLENGQLQSIGALATRLVAERDEKVQRVWAYTPHEREGAEYLYSQKSLVSLLQDTKQLLICRSERTGTCGIVGHLVIRRQPYLVQLSAHRLIDNNGTFEVKLNSAREDIAASADCTVREHCISVDNNWQPFLLALKLIQYMQRLHTNEDLVMDESSAYSKTVLPWIKALMSDARQDTRVRLRTYVLNALFLNNRLYTDTQVRRVQGVLEDAVLDCDKDPDQGAKPLLTMSLVLASEISAAQNDMLHHLQLQGILRIEVPTIMSIREHLMCMCQGTYLQVRDKLNVHTIYRVVGAALRYVVHHHTPSGVDKGTEEWLDTVMARLDVTVALKLRGHAGLCATLPRLAAQPWERMEPNRIQSPARATVQWPKQRTTQEEIDDALTTRRSKSPHSGSWTSELMRCMPSAIQGPAARPAVAGTDGATVDDWQELTSAVEACTDACKRFLRETRLDSTENIPSTLLMEVGCEIRQVLEGIENEHTRESMASLLQKPFRDWVHYMILTDYVRGGEIGRLLGMDMKGAGAAAQDFYSSQVRERIRHMKDLIRRVQRRGDDAVHTIR